MFGTFNQDNYKQLCDTLAERDVSLRNIINRFGYPPFWSRPNTFESLVHIILEQQVSLASALAALNRLKAEIGVITPENFLALTDEALKSCYFSRQKSSYARHLARHMLGNDGFLESFTSMQNDEIRNALLKIKGIGNWTVDIYLMFVLHRTDVFSLGDLAAVNTLKRLKGLDRSAGPEMMLQSIEHWKPYRTIGLMLLWHEYLELRKPENKFKVNQ